MNESEKVLLNAGYLRGMAHRTDTLADDKSYLEEACNYLIEYSRLLRAENMSEHRVHRVGCPRDTEIQVPLDEVLRDAINSKLESLGAKPEDEYTWMKDKNLMEHQKQILKNLKFARAYGYKEPEPMRTNEHTIKIQVPEGYRPGYVHSVSQVNHASLPLLNIVLVMEPEPPAIDTKDAIAGRWYECAKWGRVLCCGTGNLDEYANSFAVRDANGRTVIVFLHGHQLTESTEQFWPT